jgi:rRNA-processing protein FCF1
MCIIIDANVAHKMLGKDKDGLAVLRWLLFGQGRLVVSFDLLNELRKTKISSILIELDRTGKLIRVNQEKCNILRTKFQANVNVISNDFHLLAAIVVSECEIVFTHDKKLHKDIKNKALVPHRCSIYQTYKHSFLLNKCQCL